MSVVVCIEHGCGDRQGDAALEGAARPADGDRPRPPDPRRRTPSRSCRGQGPCRRVRRTNRFRRFTVCPPVRRESRARGPSFGNQGIRSGHRTPDCKPNGWTDGPRPLRGGEAEAWTRRAEAGEAGSGRRRDQGGRDHQFLADPDEVRVDDLVLVLDRLGRDSVAFRDRRERLAADHDMDDRRRAGACGRAGRGRGTRGRCGCRCRCRRGWWARAWAR